MKEEKKGGGEEEEQGENRDKIHSKSTNIMTYTHVNGFNTIARSTVLFSVCTILSLLLNINQCSSKF